jgi:hypothetical protein
MSILVLTSDTLIGTPATGNIEYNGQFFGTDSNASRAQMQRITQGTAVASTSGTSIDFTGLPAWVKRITVMLSGVSTNGTSQKMFQLGTGSTTFATSGYATSTTFWAASSLGTLQYTNAFQLYNLVTAADVLSGHIVFTNITGNTWVASGLIGNTGGSLNTMVIGNIALGATLTAVRMTTANGTDTFDAGSINILYEG